MNPLALFQSSIGKKVIMAVTGMMLLGFVVAHMLGNLQIFLGQDALNSYAAKLRKMPELLWVARMGLLGAFVLHVVTALTLAFQNKKARPVAYSKEGTVQASYASRVMVVSGMVILLYVLYHLAHFTLGSVHSEHFHYVDPQGRHDVYMMVVASFQNPMIAGIYIAAMIALCFHLRQAAVVFPQSLGFANDKNLPLFQKIGTLITLVVFAGYTIIPVAVLLGFVQ